MTIHLAPIHAGPLEARSHGAHARSAGRVLSHAFVGTAMLVVAVAVAAFVGVDQGGGSLLGAGAGGLALLMAFGVHIAVSRATRPVPHRAAPRAKPVSRTDRAAVERAHDTAIVRDRKQGAPAEPVVAAPAAVEPTELALSILAATRGGSDSAGSPVADPFTDWGRAAAPMPAAPIEPQAGAGLSSLNFGAHQPGRFDGSGQDRAHDAPVAAFPGGAERPFSARVGFSAFAEAPSAAADESEFERVERLVRRLADHVNQLESTPAPAAVPAQGQSVAPFEQLSLFPDGDQASAQLAASISALRRAGGVGTAGEPDAQGAEATALQAPKAPAPALAPLAAARPGAEAAVLRSAILAAINAERIGVYLEPILDLGDQRPHHYEVSIALSTADGQTIDLARAATDLSGTGLLPLVDTTRIASAVRMARRLAERGKTGSVFTDVRGETLDDGGFQDTFAGRGSHGAFPGQMVLTLSQAHVRLFTAADWTTLARLRAAGFAFAIGDVTSLDMDFHALAGAGFAFARLDAETFLTGLPIGDGTVPPADICNHLAVSGLALIVGGILDDDQLARIFGFGVLFGQGRLFGGPRAVNAVRPAGAATLAAE